MPISTLSQVGDPYETFLLAVVVPCYNGADHLADTLNAVLGQMDIDPATAAAKIIVSDDGSTDNSVEIANQFGDKVEVLAGPNRGACHARNWGASVARDLGATHVLFLDADDRVEGAYFKAAAQAAQSGADILLGQIQRQNADGQVLHIRDVEAADLVAETAFAQWLTKPQINPAGIFFRMNFFDAIGGWDDTILINQDAEIIMRGFLKKPRIARVEEGHGVYRVGHASLSSKHSELKLANYVTTLERFLEDAPKAGFGDHTKGLEDTLYGVARMCFRQGWVDPGRRALDVLRNHGITGHTGSLVHRVAASLLGLERKVKLWGR